MPNTQPNEAPDSQVPPNRKRGRKVGGMDEKDLKNLFECIQRHGEAIPSKIAGELGVPRSTLAYNFKRLQDSGWIVREGGGRSTRYRATTSEPWVRYRKGPGTQKQLPTQPSADTPPALESAKEPEPKKGFWPFGLKNLFKR